MTAEAVAKPRRRGRALLGPVLEVPGQMSIEQCIAEAEAEPAAVDPCPECAVGKHSCCDGRTLDQKTDEIVPCPCRAEGHP